MVIAHDFDYVRAASLDEALAALNAPGACVLAGGTDVVPWLRDDVIAPELLVDIKAIPELDAIGFDGERLHIGALVTFSDVLASDVVSERVPVLGEMAGQVASVGVRNRATLVGNLCSAVPSLDAGPPLLTYDADVHVVGADGHRTMPLAGWFVAPKQTRLAPGEMVAAVSAHLPAQPHGAAFLKLARYAGEDLAQANLAIVVTSDLDYRIAFGAVAPTPFRAAAIERLLAGRELDDDVIAAARALVPDVISPITDVRASAEYRTHMCGVMLDRGLRAATARGAGTGVAYGVHLI